MKRLVFYSILILVFLATCKPYEPDEADTPDAERPAVNQGTASVTIYLDGKGPAASRAMNRTFSEMGCDYFEVVFKYNKNNDGNYETAIGQWRIGERAGVSGVWRETDVDYTGVSFAPVTGKGSAILLAGKSDRTLMAIGRLSLVDGQAVSSTNLINLNTKSVTFNLAAIKAGVGADMTVADNKGLSSFLTAAGHTNAPGTLTNVGATNTLITDEEIMGIYFLAFKLNTGISATKALYTFRLHSGASGTPEGPSSAYTYANFGDYVATGGGLRVASVGTVAGIPVAGTTVEKKYPSYTTPDGGNINVNAIILLDETTVVTIENNKTPHLEFNPAVEFTFNTVGTKPGSIFALVFQIPVYALDERCSWCIRPGYGVLNYELDDGLGGMGGAVLIKTGELIIAPPSVNNFKIEIKRAPDKWRYRWVGPNQASPVVNARDDEFEEDGTTRNPEWEYNRVFQVDGLLVQLQHAVENAGPGDGEPYIDFDPVPSNIFIGPTYTNCYIKTEKLTYIIGRARKSPGTLLADEFYGLVEVTVRFTDGGSGVSAEDKFFILASGNLHVSTTSPVDNRHNSTDKYDYANIKNIRACLDSSSSYYIASINSDNDFMTQVQRAGNTNHNRIAIIRLTGSFDMSDAALNLNANIGGNGAVSDSTLIMIMATGSNVILGRKASYNGGGTRINIRGARSGLAAFYFGKWPFTGLRNSPLGLAYTMPFVVHAGGSVADVSGSNATRRFSNKMITDGTAADNSPAGGGIYNVDIDPKKYDTSLTGPPYPHTFESGVTIHSPTLLH